MVLKELEIFAKIKVNPSLYAIYKPLFFQNSHILIILFYLKVLSFSNQTSTPKNTYGFHS